MFLITKLFYKKLNKSQCKKMNRKEGTNACPKLVSLIFYAFYQFPGSNKKNLFSLAQPPNTFLTMEWNPISGSKSLHQLRFRLFQIFGDKY